MSNQLPTAADVAVVPVRLDSNCGPGAADSLWNTMIAAVETAGPVRLEVDASEVEQLGSGCLQVILAAARQLHRQQGELVVSRSSAAWEEWVRLGGTPQLAARQSDRGAE